MSLFTPVDQLVIDDDRGDCLRAVVCSILGLAPADVPNFSEMGFFSGLRDWLGKRGQQLFWIAIDDELALEKHYFGHVPEYLLVWGESPRPRANGQPKQHIVVAQPVGYGIEIVHDPHPSRAGLKKIYGFGFIV